MQNQRSISIIKEAAEVLYSHGWCLFDLSIDCIGDLFATSANGDLVKIEPLLQNTEKPLSELPDNQILLILKGYINKFVSYRLMKLLNEADSEGRRISRNIREAIKNNRTNLCAIWDFRGEVLVFDHFEFNENLPEFPLLELENKIFLKANRSVSITAILEQIGRILSDQDFYRKSVRLIDIIQIIKRLYTKVFFEETNKEKRLQLNSDELNESDLNIIRDKKSVFLQRK